MTTLTSGANVFDSTSASRVSANIKVSGTIAFTAFGLQDDDEITFELVQTREGATPDSDGCCTEGCAPTVKNPSIESVSFTPLLCCGCGCSDLDQFPRTLSKKNPRVFFDDLDGLTIRAVWNDEGSGFGTAVVKHTQAFGMTNLTTSMRGCCPPECPKVLITATPVGIDGVEIDIISGADAFGREVTVTIGDRKFVGKDGDSQIFTGLEVGGKGYSIVASNGCDEYTVQFTTGFPPEADVKVKKTASNKSPKVGETVEYTVTFTNNGPDAADGTIVKDVITEGSAVGITDSTVVAINAVGGAIFSPVIAFTSVGALADGLVVGTFPSGASVTFTYSGVATTAGITSKNTATAKAPDGVVDPNPDNNSDDTEVTPKPLEADLSVIKSVDNSNPAAGDTITYTMAYANAGPDTATGAKLKDVFASPKPANLNDSTVVTFTTAGGATTVISSPTTYGVLRAGFLATMPVGSTVTVTLPIVVTASDAGKTFSNAASITAPNGTIDRDETNNYDSIDVDVQELPDVPADPCPSYPMLGGGFAYFAVDGVPAFATVPVTVDQTIGGVVQTPFTVFISPTRALGHTHAVRNPLGAIIGYAANTSCCAPDKCFDEADAETYEGIAV